MIDVFADGYVEVPLGLRDGVLARAELDGKPAQLRLASFSFQGSSTTTTDVKSPAPQSAPNPFGETSVGEKEEDDQSGSLTTPSQQPPVKQPAKRPMRQRCRSRRISRSSLARAWASRVRAWAAAWAAWAADSSTWWNRRSTMTRSSYANPPNNALLLLALKGKGRHTLTLEVRVRLSRQGGWRVAEAGAAGRPRRQPGDQRARRGYGSPPQPGPPTGKATIRPRPARPSARPWAAAASFRSAGGPRSKKRRLIAA